MLRSTLLIKHVWAWIGWNVCKCAPGLFIFPQCFDLPRATTSQMLRSLVEQNAAVPETRTAIECELRGELEGALQVYDKLLLQLDDGEDFDGGHPACVFRCVCCLVGVGTICLIRNQKCSAVLFWLIQLPIIINLICSIKL